MGVLAEVDAAACGALEAFGAVDTAAAGPVEPDGVAVGLGPVSVPAGKGELAPADALAEGDATGPVVVVGAPGLMVVVGAADVG